MIAVIDIGNARLKWALADDGELVSPSHAVSLEGPSDAIGAVVAALPDDTEAVWLSNVAGQGVRERVADDIRARFDYTPSFAATDSRHGDLRCGYTDPTRLGVDRWLGLIAADRVVERPFCVIDAGTAVTIDAVDAAGTHLGGLILASPHLSMTALATAADGIHYSDDDPERPAAAELLATSTFDAVARGAWLAVAAALETAIAAVAARVGGQPQVLMTGGDGPLLAKWLEHPAEQRPDLVLEGLAERARHGARS